MLKKPLFLSLAIVCFSLSSWSAPPAGRTLPLPANVMPRAVEGMKKVPSRQTVAHDNGIRKIAYAPAAAAKIDLRGTILESSNWDNPAYGIYSVPMADGESFAIQMSSDVPIVQGWDNGNGIYYSTYLTTDDFGYFVEDCHAVAFDTSTGKMIYDNVTEDFSMFSFSLAEDPTTGVVYGCNSNSVYNGYNWVKIDFASMSQEVIKYEMPIYFKALGCDSKGQLYAVTEFGRFVKVDKKTGDYTEYPSNPVVPSEAGESTQYGGCVDDVNGRFLLTTYDYFGHKSALYSFDLGTGECAKLVDFPNGEQVLGLYVAAAPRSPLAPAAPEFSVECVKGAMSVNVVLNIPTKYYDGSDAAGQDFNYKVYVEADVVKEATAKAGDRLEFPIKLDHTGFTYFSAEVSNLNGDSPKARAGCFVGPGLPSSPGNVLLTRDGGNVTLTWDAVETSSDGGYLDPAGVTYIIRDMADNELKRDVKGNSETFSVTVPESGVEMLSYSVAAQYEKGVSEYVKSNTVLLGNYKMPLTMEFDDESFAQHTLIDSNEDGKTWALNFGKAMMAYNEYGPVDDWLVSPPLYLEAGKTYPFKMRVAATQSAYPERIEVKAGNSPTAAAMTINVIEPTVITDDSYEGIELSGVIVTQDAGEYYVGLHGISDMNMYNLFVMSYGIDDYLRGSTPAAVTDLTAVPDAAGLLKTEIKFTAPLKDQDGSDLKGNVIVKVVREGKDEAIYERTAQPGAVVTVPDEVPEAGEYTYTVIAADGEDVSLPASVKVYIGPRPAALVENVNAWQSADNKVMVEWTPVTKDSEGNDIKPEDVTYKVYSVARNDKGALEIGDLLMTSADGSTKCELEVKASDTQDYIYYAVKSLNRGVGSTDLKVGYAVFGKAYPTPHSISGKDVRDKYFFEGWTSDVFAQINMGSGENGIDAQDGDDSYIIVKTPYIDQSAYFSTGRVTLADVSSPRLMFWTYGFATTAETANETLVSVLVDGKEIPVKKFKQSELNPNEWNPIEIDLSEYKDKIVRVRIFTYCNGTQFSLYDNIYIGENPKSGIDVPVSAVKVRVSAGSVEVIGADGLPVVLCGVDGKVYHRGTGDFRKSLSSSTYILKVGEKPYKIVVM